MNKNTPDNFGPTLAAIQNEIGLALWEIAELCGIRRPTISRDLNKPMTPVAARKYLLLINKYNISLSYFINREGPIFTTSNISSLRDIRSSLDGKDLHREMCTIFGVDHIVIRVLCKSEYIEDKRDSSKFYYDRLQRGKEYQLNIRPFMAHKVTYDGFDWAINHKDLTLCKDLKFKLNYY